MIQAFGAVPLDLKACNVDIAAGGCYKWLCVTARLRDPLPWRKGEAGRPPTSYGWLGVDDPWNFEKPRTVLPTRHRCVGNRDGRVFSALRARAESDAAADDRNRKDRELPERTDGFPLRDNSVGTIFESLVPDHRANDRRSFVSNRMNGVDANAVADSLRKKNIIVSARGKRVRVAPHLFNNFADIETLAACLP
jgi:kynureninase